MSKRLQKICSAIPNCNVLCDVGCDHGYIGIEALNSGVAERVIFIDISNECLQKARENCDKRLIRRAEFVCRNGLGDIECDCAVIAGMGGLEIISILDNAKTPPKYIVLQPMRNVYDVRKTISQSYKIISDFKFLDGKFYDLIVAEYNKTGCKLTENELLFGKSNLENPEQDYILFLQNEYNKLSQIALACNDLDVKKRLSIVEEALTAALNKKP